MKLISLLLLLLINTFTLKAFPETTKTESFKVSGKCVECKKRIESALKIDGVTKSNWDESSNLLTVTYAPKELKLKKIQKKISLAGHDTPMFRAPEEVYDSLPSCCKYERMHSKTLKASKPDYQQEPSNNNGGHGGHH